MQNNVDQQVYAGFFVRLAAYLIDWIIVGAALLVIRIPMWILFFSGSADFVFKDFIFQYSVYDIILYLLKVTYFVLLTYFTGATLGKRLMHIKVISTEERKPTFFEIAFRESVGKFLAALIIYAGYIMVGVDKRKRGLHDMLSDTYVVYQHQKTIAVPTPVLYKQVPYAVQMPPYQAGAARQNMYVQNMGQQGNVPNTVQPDTPAQMNTNGMPNPAQPNTPVQMNAKGMPNPAQSNTPVQMNAKGMPNPAQPNTLVQMNAKGMPNPAQSNTPTQMNVNGMPNPTQPDTPVQGNTNYRSEQEQTKEE